MVNFMNHVKGVGRAIELHRPTACTAPSPVCTGAQFCPAFAAPMRVPHQHSTVSATRRLTRKLGRASIHLAFSSFKRLLRRSKFVCFPTPLDPSPCVTASTGHTRTALRCGIADHSSFLTVPAISCIKKQVDSTPGGPS